MHVNLPCMNAGAGAYTAAARQQQERFLTCRLRGNEAEEPDVVCGHAWMRGVKVNRRPSLCPVAGTMPIDKNKFAAQKTCVVRQVDDACMHGACQFARV